MVVDGRRRVLFGLGVRWVGVAGLGRECGAGVGRRGAGAAGVVVGVAGGVGAGTGVGCTGLLLVGFAGGGRQRRGGGGYGEQPGGDRGECAVRRDRLWVQLPDEPLVPADGTVGVKREASVATGSA